MKIVTTLFLTLFVQIIVFSQSDKPQANQWKELILDSTTADESIEKFGQPKYDKPNEKVKLFEIDRLLTKQLKEKKWRIMNFKNIPNSKNTLLIFNKDNKLVVIHFQPSGDLAPSTFVSAYETPFKPLFSTFDQAWNEKDFLRDGSGNVYAKSYPVTYSLLATTEKSFILGMVGNASFGGMLKKDLGIPDSTLTYPGKIIAVELISKTLENKDNIDMLK